MDFSGTVFDVFPQKQSNKLTELAKSMLSELWLNYLDGVEFRLYAADRLNRKNALFALRDDHRLVDFQDFLSFHVPARTLQAMENMDEQEGIDYRVVTLKASGIALCERVFGRE